MGKFYSDILKMENTIIYHEEGITLADNTIEPLFLHYINNNLIGTQGKKRSNSPDKEIDCRF